MALSCNEITLPLLLGEVTRIVDPSDFWLRYYGSDKEVESWRQFEESMNVSYMQLPLAKLEEITENDCVLVQCPVVAVGSNGSPRATSSRHWRRATVIRVDRSKNVVDVFYCDYGHTEIVPPNRVSKELPEMASTPPVTCARCCLAGIRPIARSWTSRGVKTFEKLTVDKLLQVTFLSYDQSSMCYKLALYSRDENARSITHQLLEAETGLPTDEMVEEFAKDVQPAPFTSFNKDFFNDQEEEEEIDDDDKERDDGEDVDDVAAAGVAATSGVLADGIVVPNFNLSVLQQHRGLSAEELQRQKESALQAARRAELQKDMITCHKQMETFVLPGSGQKWGNSDLLIGRQLSADADFEAVDKSALTDTANFVAASSVEITINPVQATNAAHVVERADQPDVVKEELAEAVKDDFLDEMLPLDKSQQVTNRENTPSPPPECMTQEERNYYLQKKLSQILHDAYDGEEQDVTLSKCYSLVPDETINKNSNVNLLLDVLIDEATRKEEMTEIALHIIEAYSDVITELELEEVLKQARDKYIKLPVAKMQRYHADFSKLIVRLLHQATVWPTVIKTVVQDFCFNCLEKWIIFNKRGAQSGLVHRHLEKMYVECLEIVLPRCLSTLQSLDAERVQFFTDELREKVLEAEVDYSVRSRLLSLLLSVLTLTRTPEEPAPAARPTLTRGCGVQCQLSPSHHPPTTARWPAVDVCLEVGPAPQMCVRKDAEVQTEAAREEGNTRRGSWSSVDSFDRADVSSAGCSRSRRKLAVMEHLQKTVSAVSSHPSRHDPSALPDCASSPVDLPPCPAFSGSSVDLIESSGLEKLAMGDARQTWPVAARQEITDQSWNPVQRTGDACRPAETPVDWFREPLALSSLVSDSSSLAVDERDQRMDSVAAESSINLSLAAEVVSLSEEGTDVDRSGVAQSDKTPSSRPLQNKSFFSAVTSISQSAWNSVFGGPLRRVSFGPKAEAAEPCTILPAVDSLSAGASPDSTTSSSAMTPIIDAESDANIAAEDQRDTNAPSITKIGSLRESFAEEVREICSSDSDVPADWEELASPTNSPPSEPEVSGVCDLSDLQFETASKTDGQCVASLSQHVQQNQDEAKNDQKIFKLDKLNARMINQKSCTDSTVQYSHLKGINDDDSSPGSADKNLANCKVFEADSGQIAMANRVETVTPLLLPLQGRATYTPERLTQLSLQSIASGLLHFDLHTSVDESAHSLLEDESAHSLLEESGEEQSRVDSASTKEQDQAAAPCDTTQDDDIYISEDERADSDPSDWEDRVSPFPDEFGSEKWQHMHKGDNQSISPQSRPHIVDDKGDGESWHQEAAMTPAVMTSSPLKEETGQDCPRGDLGFMAREQKRGKKKTTFRPWDEQKFPVAKSPTASRGPWIPSVRCTNCKALDHLRNECPKPRKHILLAVDNPSVY